jgi:glycosyltransferase involved in cell wall biosynthesis
MNLISVTILVKNSEETLESTLESVASFKEVILLDTGSTDQTLSIAQKFPNVKVMHAPFEGFGKTHNVATSFASYDWILSLDSDEILSQDLISELHGKTLDPNCVYAIRRRNFLYGKEMKTCSGWHPDWIVRLYHRKNTCFDEAKVHEKIIQGSLRKEHLQHTMSHVPYRCISQFLQKMQSYTDLFAKQYQGRKRGSMGAAIFHGWGAFLKSYVLKKGFLQGSEGFLISAYNGHVAFYKYLKLKEENAKNCDEQV